MDPNVGDWSTVTLRYTSAAAVARRAGVLSVLALFALVLAVLPAWARYADIVLDTRTGQVLHEVNADVRTYPASLTKLMTLYLTFEALEAGRLTLSQTVPISAHAAAQAPTKLGLVTGQRISVHDLIMGLVTKSANDGAVVLGEALGGTEPKFAVMMTEKAHALGMSDTTFKNASGLPNLRQMTTARDMAKLALALQRDFPQDYHYFSTREFTWKGTVIRNHNNLLGRVEGVDGMKTGFIQASGFNLVASAERNGRRYIAVVLGGATPKARDQEAASLLEHAFAGDLTPGTTRVAALPNRPSKAKKKAKAVASATATKAPAGKLVVADASGSSESFGDTITNWAIQVGAYSRQASARNAATKAMSQLDQLVADAEIAVVGGGKALYRARIVGLTESSAQNACRLLRKSGTDCMAISPASAGHSLAAVPN
jgi:D-alanyl-D-alanine carboxypeptidase